MSKREQFEKLLHQLVDASFDCGAWPVEPFEDYDVVWRRCVETEVKLRDLLEPYLPKE